MAFVLIGFPSDNDESSELIAAHRLSGWSGTGATQSRARGTGQTWCAHKIVGPVWSRPEYTALRGTSGAGTAATKASPRTADAWETGEMPCYHGIGKSPLF